METYNYEFVTECVFDPVVRRHSYKLRVQPMESECQRVVSSQVVLTPATDVNYAVDSFGNNVIFGLIDDEHGSFNVLSKGVVECGEYGIADTMPAEYYRYPTPLTQWNDDLRALATGCDPVEIMHAIHSKMRYQRFVTTNATTAIEAYYGGVGVCQDFAHVMIAACRATGYLARYVNGMVVGEGETHAWVEVYRPDGRWVGYDPTFDRRITTGYIKFAHGRDTNDCPVNRGRFFNRTTETMTIKCKMTDDTDSDIS